MDKNSIKWKMLCASCFITIYEAFRNSAFNDLEDFFGFTNEQISGKREHGIFIPKPGITYTDMKSPGFVPLSGVKYCDFQDMEYIHDKDAEARFNKDVLRCCKNAKGKPIKDLSIFMFLVTMGLITQEDFEKMKRFFALRNELTHELFNMLCEKTPFPSDIESSTKSLLDISAKASENWIKTIEKDEGPDLTDKDMGDRECFSFNTLFCSRIRHSIFG